MHTQKGTFEERREGNQTKQRSMRMDESMISRRCLCDIVIISLGKLKFTTGNFFFWQHILYYLRFSIYMSTLYCFLQIYVVKLLQVCIWSLIHHSFILLFCFSYKLLSMLLHVLELYYYQLESLYGLHALKVLCLPQAISVLNKCIYDTYCFMAALGCI